MKLKKITWILVLSLMLALLAGCGSRGSGSSSSASSGTSSSDSSTSSDDTDEISFEMPELSDVLTEHTVFLTAWGDGWSEYQVVFYGADSGKLRSLLIETHLQKPLYSREDVDALDINEVYPGFDQLSFASVHVVEEATVYAVVVVFNDLYNNDNLHQLDDLGILDIAFTSDSEGADAESYMTWLRSEGARELSYTDSIYDDLHYSYAE